MALEGLVVAAVLASRVAAQNGCDCAVVNGQVDWDTLDSSGLPTGWENVSEKSCILPCRLVDLGIEFGPYDFGDIQNGCTLAGLPTTNPSPTYFVWFDAESADDCVNSPSVISGPSCAEGYHCEFDMELCNMNEWPQYCPPENACAVQLLQGSACADRTNEHQPELCEQSYYCPTRARYNSTNTNKIWCPSGSHCPIGSAAPIECSSLSYCPSGSEAPRQIEFLWMAAAIDVVVGLILFLRVCYMESMALSVAKAHQRAPRRTGGGVPTFQETKLYIGDKLRAFFSPEIDKINLVNAVDPDDHETALEGGGRMSIPSISLDVLSLISQNPTGRHRRASNPTGRHRRASSSGSTMSAWSPSTMTSRGSSTSSFLGSFFPVGRRPRRGSNNSAYSARSRSSARASTRSEDSQTTAARASLELNDDDIPTPNSRDSMGFLTKDRARGGWARISAGARAFIARHYH